MHFIVRMVGLWPHCPTPFPHSAALQLRAIAKAEMTERSLGHDPHHMGWVGIRKVAKFERWARNLKLGWLPIRTFF